MRSLIASTSQVQAIQAGATQIRIPIRIPRWAEAGEEIEIDPDDKPVVIASRSGCLAEIQPPYSVGDIVAFKESFWAKHDTDCGDYGAQIDCGLVLEVSKKFHPGIQYVASPECMTPPHCEPGQTVIPYKRQVAPGDWWLAPPDNWDGADAQHQLRGQWEFGPWGLYSRLSGQQMPDWAVRIHLEITGVRCEQVKSISEADALACFPSGVGDVDCRECQGTGNFYRHDEDGDYLPCGECRDNLGVAARVETAKTDWQARYGKRYPWDTAWAWAFDFKRVGAQA